MSKSKSKNQASLNLIRNMMERGEISELGTSAVGTSMSRPSHSRATHNVIHINPNGKCAVSSLMKSLGVNLSQSSTLQYHIRVNGFMREFPHLFTNKKKIHINSLINPKSPFLEQYGAQNVWRASNPTSCVYWNKVIGNNTFNKVKSNPVTYEPGRKLNEGRRILPQQYNGKVVFLWHSDHWDVALPLI
jgi:hypothetical protein